MVLNSKGQPAGTWSEDSSLTVGDAEVCATTRSANLQPYASEYEGYMGNYGNTMDRWYRRAALVVWPRDRDFTNRAEASPAWAPDELAARVRAGDLAGARAAAAKLAPFWDTAARAQGQAGFFGKALRTASSLDDAETAGMLLRPFGSSPIEPSATRVAQRWSCSPRSATSPGSEAPASWPAGPG
jgi:hypothetical protein